MKRLIKKCENDEEFNVLYNRILNVYNEIPKGQYIGNMRAHDCDKNSIKAFKKYKDDVYIGYILFYDDIYKSWRKAGHVFNVKNNQVKEYTDISPIIFNDVFYFGEKVENVDINSIWQNLKNI